MHKQSGLFTDFYSFTMMQGYFLTKRNPVVVFDMFIRKSDKHMGYMIFAGLQPLLEHITALSFSDKDIEYLRAQKIFREEFLDYLRQFRFTGSIWAMQEGSVCFPQEPVLKVRAPIIEAQLIEGLILNTINYHTLIATKAARICYVAKEKTVVEFGLRRSHGPNGANYASRAAYIGGISATSNTEASNLYDIPITGTMAHSWIMSYEDEHQAFRDFADVYPSNVTFLLDTHNTLASGLPHAIAVGKTLKAQNIDFSVRLDSGDIEYLSKQVRKVLNREGLTSTKIIATNDLNEEIIAQLLASNAPIDIIGVGTNLVTGGTHSSLPGVYKISEITYEQERRPLIKTSNNIEKSSLPSSKQVLRFSSASKYSDKYEEKYIADLIVLDGEPLDYEQPLRFNHPFLEHKHFMLQQPFNAKALLQEVIVDGKIIATLPPIKEIRTYVQQELTKLDSTYLRLINPHEYHVSISQDLKTLRDDLAFQT